MSDNLKEIDGVGPAREDNLNEAGYETYSDLGEADYEQLAEEIPRMPEDSALEIVVQAQNLAELEEAEVEDEESEDGDADAETEDAVEEAEEDAVEEAEEDEDGETQYSVELSFDGEHQYDTFYHTLVEERCNLQRTNRAGAESYEKMLQSMQRTSPDESYTVDLTEDELNDLHNAVLEQRIDYQGDNLIEYMDALRIVEEKINDVREEHLF